jgi:hypothetical protein
MSTAVGDVVARIRTEFDGSGVDEANEAMGTLQDNASNIGENFSKGKDAVQSFSEKVTASGVVISDLEDHVGSVGRAIQGMVAGAVGGFGIAAFLNMVKDTTMQMQTLQVQFTSTFGGASEGASQLSSMSKFADQFGVSISSAGSAYVQFGISTKGTNQNLSQDMKDFQNAAAGTGQTLDSVAGAVGNFYQLVQRLGGAGGSSSRYATSLLTSQIIDQATYNKLRLEGNQGDTPQQQLNTILAGIQQNYAGAGQAQAGTLSGQLQTFENQFKDSSTSSMSPIMSGLQSGLKDVNSFMGTGQFKQGVQDVTQLVSAITQAVDKLAPFAKDMLDVAGAVAGAATHFHEFDAAIGTVVAALIAWKGIEITKDILDMSSGLKAAVLGLSEKASAQNADTSAMRSGASAMTEYNAQLADMIALQRSAMVQSGMVVPSADVVPGVAAQDPYRSYIPPVAGGNPALEGISPTFGQKMGVAGSAVVGGIGDFLSSRAFGLIAGGGLAAFGPQIGNAVGGPQQGQMLGSVLQGAGAGAMVGSMIGPEGTAIGAGAGAIGGALLGVFESGRQAQQENTAAVGKLTDAFKAANPVTPGPHEGEEIFSAYQSAHAGSYVPVDHIKNQLVMGGFQGAEANMPQIQAETRHNEAHSKNLDQVDNQMKNMENMIKFVQAMQPGTNRQTAVADLQSSGVDMTQTLSASKVPLDNLVQSLQNLGSASATSEEAVANMAQSIAAQVGGQYGEAMVPFNSIQKQLANNGSSLQDILTPGKNQPPSVGGMHQTTDANGLILPENYATGQPVTAQQLQNAPSPAYTAANIAQLQYQQQNMNTAFQLTQAEQGLTQATWGLEQAQFQATQAAFQMGQAEFSLGRAMESSTVATLTQQGAADSLTTALNSGYAPANANVQAQIQQAVSLSSQQIAAINSEVTAYNTLEQAMYGTNASGQSLYTTYQTLQGAVQVLQAQTQQYQNLLNEPLAGSKAYSAQQEQYQVQEAAIQQQIATLELQKIPTQDPRIQALQAQLAEVQTESQLATAQNTQGLGQQQFNIQQAQLGPEQSYGAQLQAAQAMGGLNTQLLAANQALAAITPQYDAVNNALQIQSQRNQAVTSSLSQLASADQNQIQQNNALTVAQNQVVTAANSLKVSQQGVQTAQWQLQSATNNYQNAIFSYAIQLQTDYGSIASQLQTYLGNYSQFIQNIGTVVTNGFSETIQGITQQMQIFQALSIATMAQNTAGIATLQSLLTMSENSVLATGKPLSAGLVNTILGAVSAGDQASQMAQFDGGGTITGSGTAGVHSGEIILPAQVAQQVQVYGGTPLQGKVGAALVDGIESSGDPTVLAGGIGPAAGLFQFEPGTWLDNGGGAFHGTMPNGMSGAQGATWQQQVQVFINASRGNNFGAWGPDLGAGYGYSGPPLPHSKVANAIASFPPSLYHNGGFVPGAGPSDATLLGGEFVLSKSMLESLANGSSPLSSAGGGSHLTIGNGAIQVSVTISADIASLIPSLDQEIAQTVEQALEEVVSHWNGM